MGWEFFTLDEKNSAEYISQAYNWYKRTPGFLRSYSEFDENIQNFKQDLLNGRLFVGILDGVFSGMVYGEIKTENIIEGHLFCPPKTSEDFIIALITYAKSESLKTYDFVVTHILKKHRFLHRVMVKSGFVDTGMKSWMGVYRNKLMEVNYYSTLPK